MGSQTVNANPITTLIVGAFFAAIGLSLFFFYAKPTLERSQASKNWPKVTGVVKVSEVTQYRNNDKKMMFSPNVVFEYKLNGRSYTSSSITVGSGSSSSNSSGAHRVANEYPVGSVVKAAYDPEEPSYAVLKTGVSTGTYVAYYLGLVFAGIGLMVCAYPLLQIAFAVFFIGASLTSSAKPQSTVDARFPEENPSPGYSGEATTQMMETLGSNRSSEISEGITIQ